jgi:hypothetical protein
MSKSKDPSGGERKGWTANLETLIAKDRKRVDDTIAGKAIVSRGEDLIYLTRFGKIEGDNGVYPVMGDSDGNWYLIGEDPNQSGKFYKGTNSREKEGLPTRIKKYVKGIRKINYRDDKGNAEVQFDENQSKPFRNALKYSKGTVYSGPVQRLRNLIGRKNPVKASITQGTGQQPVDIVGSLLVSPNEYRMLLDYAKLPGKR